MPFGALVTFSGRPNELSSIYYHPNRALERHVVLIVLHYFYSILTAFVDNIVFHRENYDYSNLKSYVTVKSNA